MSNDDLKKTVGRTPWDAAVEVGRLLGILTPILIVFAGAVYGFYKYLQLYENSQKALNAARTEMRLAYKEELQAANQALRDTTKHMSDLSSKQLIDIDSQLQLRKKMDDEIEKQRNKLYDAQKQAEKEIQNLEKARAKFEQFQKEYNNLQKNKMTLENRLKDLNITTKKLEDDLKKKKRSISTYGENIEDLVKKLLNLSNLIIDGNEEESKQLALSIRETYADPKEILIALTNSPFSESEKLLLTLLGMSEKKVKEAIEQGLNYSLWFKAVETEDSSGAGYAGVVQQKKDILEKVIFIEVTNGKVSDIELLNYTMIVTAAEVNNWYKMVNYLVSDDGSELTNIDGQSWSFEKLLASIGLTAKLVFGEFQDINIINFSQFMDEYRSFYDFSKAKDDDFVYIIRMNERAKNYDAQKRIGKSLYSFPKDLSEVIIRFLNAVVNKEEDIAKTMLDDSINPEVLGVLAATVLKDDFEIISADLKGHDELIQQSTPIDNPPAGPVAARLLAQFRPSWSGENNKVEFVFRKNQEGWRLVEFRSGLYELPYLR